MQREMLVLSGLAAELVDQAAVLQRRTRVVDQGLEQSEIVVVKGVEVPQPVGNQHHTQGPAVRSKWCHHRVGDVRLHEECAEPRSFDWTLKQQGFVLSHDASPCTTGGIDLDRL